jgi:hypothetical protein
MADTGKETAEINNGGGKGNTKPNNANNVKKEKKEPGKSFTREKGR